MGRWNSFKQFVFGKKQSAVAKVIATPGSGGAVFSPVDYTNFAKETYLKNVIAFKSIDEIGKSVASVPWKQFRKLSDDEREISEEGTIPDLLERPNPNDGLPYLLLRASAYLAMSGNSFFEKVAPITGPNKGTPKELYVLRPDRFKIKINPDTGQIVKYIYSVSNRHADFDVNKITGQANVLHLKGFHPLDDWWGAAATQPAAREIDTSNSATQWNKSILDNEGRPGMIFTLIGAGEAQLDELERHLDSRTGPQNAGKNLIIAGDTGTKAEPYGWSPKDLDFNEGDLRLSRKICTAYGVPPELLGIQDATYANRAEARLFFWENTVFFYLNYIREELNNWLYQQGSSLFIDYILDDVPAFAIKRDKIWKRAQESNFLTQNEKRKMVGYEPDDDGDVILVAAGLVPLANVNMEIEEDVDEGEIEDEEDEDEKEKLREEGYSEDEINDMLGYSDEKASYKCECVSCGYKKTSKVHCNTFKCPKCGGKMRREGRPGPGQE